MSDRERPEALFLRVRDAMHSARAGNPAITLDGLAAAAVSALTLSPRARIKLLLLQHVGEDPRCALCQWPIPMDAEPNHPASFTVDHVAPRAAGGRWELENVRPAHKLCNEARAVFDAGRKPKPRLERKLAEMRKYIRERMALGSAGAGEIAAAV